MRFILLYILFATIFASLGNATTVEYSTAFKDAVKADIKRRIAEEDGFRDKFMAITDEFSAEEVRDAAYRKYAQKDEFKKYLKKNNSEKLAEQDIDSIFGTPNAINYTFQNILIILLTVCLICIGIWGIKPKFPNLYSIKGRVPRKTYWIWWFSMLPIFFLMTIFFSYFSGIILTLTRNEISPFWIVLPLYFVFVLIYIPYICIQIRRMHDMNISGYWYCLFMSINHTPLVIIKWIILGCIRGTKGTNKYGEPIIIHKSQATNYIEFIKSKIESLEIQKNKKTILTSFIIGLLLGIIVTYAISNK